MRKITDIKDCVGHIKVLPISNYLTNRPYSPWEYYIDCDMEQIEPVFYRNGRYYDRKLKLVWEEYDGRAYLESDIETFKYELSLLNHKRLEPDEIKSIETLMVYRRCPKSLYELHYMDRNVTDLIDVVRDMNKYMNKRTR